jgi:hypothetical protein
VRAVGRRIAGAGKPAVAAMGPIGGLASYDEIAARFG